MDVPNLEFTKQLGLAKGPREKLKSEITRTAGEIARHRAYVQQAPDHHMRKDALQAVVSWFGELRSALKAHQSALETMLRGDFLSEFGKYLSYYGLAAITGSSFGQSQTLGSRDGLVSAQEMDRHTQSHRASIADTIGLKAFDSHLELFELPLSRMLALESADQGGRPPLLYRNYVIQQLGRLYEEIFDEPPTTTVNGTFYKLVRNSLLALGFEDRGLKSAIPRALKKAGLKTKRPRGKPA